MIKAEIVADSLNPYGQRLTTLLVTMPRYILAEFNTHRMLSKNSASSRAIPFEKMVKSVEQNPFIPIAWQKDHKGMQGNEYITDINHLENITADWLEAKDSVVRVAKKLHNGFYNDNTDQVTKQLLNRLLEAFMWHTVLVSATEWENFFALRCPQYTIDGEVFRSKKDTCKKFINLWEKDFTDVQWLELNKGQADIHMMFLAEAIWDAINESTPKELNAGEWHIPFADNIQWTKENWSDELSCVEPLNDGKTDRGTTAKIQIATVRCARTSYTVIGEEGKKPNYEADIKLHDRLATSGHWSPFEHCAKVMTEEEFVDSVNGSATIRSGESWRQNYHRGWSGNFRGFIQYRKMFKNENITK